MKYTNYLIKSKFIDIEGIVDNNPEYLRPITISMSIIGAVGGICIICGMFPITCFIDTSRNVRYQYLKNFRKTYKLKEISLN